MNFTAVNETSRPGSTARSRLAQHAENPVCAGCHKLTDPIGLTLENFDGAGSFRAKENGVELDLSGSLNGVDFSGAPGLGQMMHDSPAAPMCLADKLYRFGVGRELADAEAPFIEYLTAAFGANGYRVPELMRAIALSKTFYAVAAPVKPPVAHTSAAATRGNRS